MPGGELYGLQGKAQGSRKIFLRSICRFIARKREATRKIASFSEIPARFFYRKRKLISASAACG
ncbi:hypothetical protein PRCB_10330 [Pantoea rodasii]|uniref:Uncharacterized protein n=1 Tax=Pantoea rodasii TaxID=1076549 RepID=A0A2M9WDZ6_9GAMM|nr:hypothetical protein PRCB_10330 [Pantoea rodasii]